MNGPSGVSSSPGVAQDRHQRRRSGDDRDHERLRSSVCTRAFAVALRPGAPRESWMRLRGAHEGTYLAARPRSAGSGQESPDTRGTGSNGQDALLPLAAGARVDRARALRPRSARARRRPASDRRAPHIRRDPRDRDVGRGAAARRDRGGHDRLHRHRVLDQPARGAVLEHRVLVPAHAVAAEDAADRARVRRLQRHLRLRPHGSRRRRPEPARRTSSSPRPSRSACCSRACCSSCSCSTGRCDR